MRPDAGASANKPWHSTAIVERVSATGVKTASGSVYVLQGIVAGAASDRRPLTRGSYGLQGGLPAELE